jgi:hypothetical protein
VAAVPTVLGWVRYLENKIAEQVAYELPFNRRYRNEHVLPFIEREYREVYGDARVNQLLAIHPPKSGVAAIGIDALTERLRITQATSSDDSADAKKAVQIVNTAWEDSDLPVMHPEAFRESQIAGRSWGLVTRALDGQRAIGSIESARQCAGHRMAAPPYDTDAWLKISTDEWTGKRIGFLRLVGKDFNLIEAEESTPDPEDPTAPWSRWTVVGEPVDTKLNYVPAFEFPHSARLLDAPQSEIERIATEVDIVDLIEGLMVFAGHFGAVPIRFVEGLEVPRDPKDPSKPLLGADGKPAIGFNPRADHTWFAGPLRDAGGKVVGTPKFGQLTPAGLDGFVTWANHASGKIRAQTKVASTYYSLELKSHMSAELLKTDEAPMVRRVRAIGELGPAGVSYRRYMQCMLEIEDPTLARNVRVGPLWDSPETRIEAADVDAFQKAVASGLGVRFAAQKFLGLSPEDADKAATEAEKRADEVAQAAQQDPMMAKILDGDFGVRAAAGAA